MCGELLILGKSVIRHTQAASRRTIDWRFTTADAAVSSVTNKALEQVLPVEVLKALENFNKALRREDGVFWQLRKGNMAAAAAGRKFE